MPDAPRKPCGKCPNLQPCPNHPKVAWAASQARPRIRGAKLQQLRQALFTKEPLCRQCKANGRTSMAIIRDHIIPVAEGGTDDPSNIQPLCGECSQVKTAEEAKRGMARAR